MAFCTRDSLTSYGGSTRPIAIGGGGLGADVASVCGGEVAEATGWEPWLTCVFVASEPPLLSTATPAPTTSSAASSAPSTGVLTNLLHGEPPDGGGGGGGGSELIVISAREDHSHSLGPARQEADDQRDGRPPSEAGLAIVRLAFVVDRLDDRVHHPAVDLHRLHAEEGILREAADLAHRDREPLLWPQAAEDGQHRRGREGRDG